ncbi:hypothetical protein DFH09DRAFT_1096874 [Mycena vulgaris]|nr:hypothetical protein DFH09DRAFT_1096874 [Mycena vulgaris]
MAWHTIWNIRNDKVLKNPGCNMTDSEIHNRWLKSVNSSLDLVDGLTPWVAAGNHVARKHNHTAGIGLRQTPQAADKKNIVGERDITIVAKFTSRISAVNAPRQAQSPPRLDLASLLKQEIIAQLGLRDARRSIAGLEGATEIRP